MNRTALALTALAAALLTAQVTTATTPAAAAAAAPAVSTQAPSASVWDLKPLYPSVEAWDAERKAILAELPKLKALAGTLGASAASLRAGMDQITAVRRRLDRMAVYASLAADIDTQNNDTAGRSQLGFAAYNQFGEATSFVNTEVAALGSDKLEAFIKADAGLAKHAYSLRTIVRLAAHTLSGPEEALLASSAEPLQQPQAIYNLLANADMPWPKIKIRGKEVLLDQEQYVAHRTDPDPKVRLQVYKAFWPVFKAYERTLGATYGANLKGTVFQARARKFDSSVQMAQSGGNIPEGVYRTLVQEANNGLPALHRYFKLRSKMLGLKAAGYQDVYVPLVKAKAQYTQDEAEALTLEALKPLGSDYTSKLAAGFKGNWMHSVAQRGKRSGAYMNGSAYDVHPYLLMSFTNNYNSVSTLAHEWGHAMHTVYTTSTQPYETSDYATFIAEIPSTANELLLADYMVGHAKTKDEKIFALTQELENIRTTFFRQAMFAEFELKSHEAAEKGEAITGEKLTGIYLDLLKRYHGDAEGVVKIDPLYGIEWAYIPHFYNDFYVYQYATCISAAAFFAEGIGKGDTALRDRYFTLLKAGGSDEPYKLLLAAGLDMAKPDPYQAVVKRMNKVMDELEALTASK